jgi:hypothetical protein
VVLAALPALLVFVQYALFAFGGLATPEGTPVDADGVPLVVQGPPVFIVALHVLNAVLILGITAAVFRRAGRWPRPRRRCRPRPGLTGAGRVDRPAAGPRPGGAAAHGRDVGRRATAVLGTARRRSAAALVGAAVLATAPGSRWWPRSPGRAGGSSGRRC